MLGRDAARDVSRDCRRVEMRAIESRIEAELSRNERIVASRCACPDRTPPPHSTRPRGDKLAACLSVRPGGLAGGCASRATTDGCGMTPLLDHH